MTGFLAAYVVVMWPLSVFLVCYPPTWQFGVFYPIYWLFVYAVSAVGLLRVLRLVTFRFNTYGFALVTAVITAWAALAHVEL